MKQFEKNIIMFTEISWKKSIKKCPDNCPRLTLYVLYASFITRTLLFMCLLSLVSGRVVFSYTQRIKRAVIYSTIKYGCYFNLLHKSYDCQKRRYPNHFIFCLLAFVNYYSLVMEFGEPCSGEYSLLPTVSAIPITQVAVLKISSP